jgi:hypothetical protein
VALFRGKRVSPKHPAQKHQLVRFASWREIPGCGDRACKCGPGSVSRLLKAGSVFRRFAGCLFLSPLSGEALRVPADVGADRFAGSFPRSA